ncbi:hypothetical protein FQ775_02445 [Nitratireductor mangrovi]|uniref:Lipoprotein n=1 Tax=Nitratireductor mangrovi TaxID=2599600 RepID=A0A5B8KUY8_9HYPH|nr:hypothetical protein [Nitratireductor mangrovi]QDY99319.1 hypothetical protein FQ775_02445 [Nitratireductor mangrovi]
MKKLIIASTSALALLGLAACSDNTDMTTTQSTEPEVQETLPLEPTDPNAVPLEEENAPATDDTTTQSVEPDQDEAAPAETEAAPEQPAEEEEIRPAE